MNYSKKKLLTTLFFAFILISSPCFVSHIISNNNIILYDAIPHNTHND